jgi:hypothetical protein
MARNPKQGLSEPKIVKRWSQIWLATCNNQGNFTWKPTRYLGCHGHLEDSLPAAQPRGESSMTSSSSQAPCPRRRHWPQTTLTSLAPFENVWTLLNRPPYHGLPPPLPVALQSLKDLGRLTYRSLGLFRHMVGLLGRVISPSQGLYLHRTTQHRRTRTNIHALSGIRTHNPSNQSAKTHTSDRTATVTGICTVFEIPAPHQNTTVTSLWVSNITVTVKTTFGPTRPAAPSLQKKL